VAAFLSDNALTRSWQGTLNRHVLGPLERMTVGDEVLREALPGMVAEVSPWQGRLSDEQVQALQALKGAEVNVPGVEEVVRAASDPAQKVKDQVVGLMNGYNPDREAQLRAAQVLMDRRNRGIQEGWSQARTVLGSPPVAYSLVGAGGAMGTAAAMQAYDWWMSQQQQGQKESQLPLGGGVQA
jgi:hypothetical protein